MVTFISSQSHYFTLKSRVVIFNDPNLPCITVYEDDAIFAVCTTILDFVQCRIKAALLGKTFQFEHPSGVNVKLLPDGNLSPNFDPYFPYFRDLSQQLDTVRFPRIPTLADIEIKFIHPGLSLFLFEQELVGTYEIRKVAGIRIEVITAIWQTRALEGTIEGAETNLEAWARLFGKIPRVVWTTKQSPFSLGISSEVIFSYFEPTGFTEVEGIPLFLVKIGRKLVVCDGYTGGIVGPSLTDVTQDIKASTSQEIYAQLRSARTMVATGTEMQPSDFEALYSKS